MTAGPAAYVFRRANVAASTGRLAWLLADVDVGLRADAPTLHAVAPRTYGRNEGLVDDSLG